MSGIEDDGSGSYEYDELANIDEIQGGKTTDERSQSAEETDDELREHIRDQIETEMAWDNQPEVERRIDEEIERINKEKDEHEQPDIDPEDEHEQPDIDPEDEHEQPDIDPEALAEAEQDAAMDAMQEKYEDEQEKYETEQTDMPKDDDDIDAFYDTERETHLKELETEQEIRDNETSGLEKLQPIPSNEIKTKLRILETSKFFDSPRTVTETVQQLREYGWSASPLVVSKALAKMASNKEIMKKLEGNKTSYFADARMNEFIDKLDEQQIVNEVLERFKIIAASWIKDKITDEEFLQKIQERVNEHDIGPFEGGQSHYDPNRPIPDWVKNNAKWWVGGQIGNAGFVSSLQYLYQNGFIKNPEHIISIPIDASNKDKSKKFLPSKVECVVNETIRWKNDDVMAHNITSGSPDSGPDGNFDVEMLNPGESFSWTPKEPGKYPFLDLRFPWLTGTINVKAQEQKTKSKTKQNYQRDELSEKITPDVWTIDDMLGYEAYAHAIYKFLTHTQTVPPLTISIQAPWGGGKTSLMRMVQNELDSNIVKKNTTVNNKQPALNEVIDELDSPGKEKLQLDTKPEKRVTIWFNAWKYQNTEQVWAGLADSIIKQVVEQLSPKQCQKFWLRLHLRRTSKETIDSLIQKHVLSNWKAKVKKYIPAYLLVISASIITLIVDSYFAEIIPATGLGVLTLTILGSGLGLFKQHLMAKADVEKESANSILGKYVSVPDYAKNLGMLHHVEEDLRGVFDIIPESSKPIVIFIDDLDRCAPSKVANVMEAINLFLAADLPPCIFIIGMDTEMVAAALEESHSKIIEKLPKYDSQTPVGWRFMDKFVQLPIILPRPDKKDLESYVDGLVAKQINKEKISSAIHEIKTTKNVKNPSKIIQNVINKRKLSKEEASVLDKKLSEIEHIKIMDKKLEEIENSTILSNVIKKTSSVFSDNPRELKRYVNLLRFQYFICTARESRKQIVPPLETLARWIILSLKWPDMVRWLQRGQEYSDSDIEKDNDTTKRRLLKLERIAKDSQNMTEWKDNIEKYLRVDEDSIRWARDHNLWQFFIQENNIEKSKRISEFAGKGMY